VPSRIVAAFYSGFAALPVVPFDGGDDDYELECVENFLLRRFSHKNMMGFNIIAEF
jgi:hypothetical protein